MGVIRRGVPRHLHCQSGRLHDHEGRVPRVHRGGRLPAGETVVPQTDVQIRHHTVEPHGQHAGEILQGDARVHEGLQQELRVRGDRGGYQRVSDKTH